MAGTGGEEYPDQRDGKANGMQRFHHLIC